MRKRQWRQWWRVRKLFTRPLCDACARSDVGKNPRNLGSQPLDFFFGRLPQKSVGFLSWLSNLLAEWCLLVEDAGKIWETMPHATVRCPRRLLTSARIRETWGRSRWIFCRTVAAKVRRFSVVIEQIVGGMVPSRWRHRQHFRRQCLMPLCFIGIVFKIKSCVSTLKGALSHRNDSHGRFSKILR